MAIQTRESVLEHFGVGPVGNLVRRSSACVLLVLACSGCSDESVVAGSTVQLQCPDTPVLHTGEATYYTFASGAGACMFDSTPNDLMVGAMNRIDYAGSALCGACVRVTGPKGTILIRVVDLCPECPRGNIDLSPLAFSGIGDTSLGHVPITWSIIPCGYTAPIVYHFNDGSSQWWTAVQIRGSRNPIFSLEYRTSQHLFQNVQRADFNYFIEPSGMGPGPYTFRVTDAFGHVLVDSAISLVVDGDVSGHAQFPPCGP